MSKSKKYEVEVFVRVRCVVTVDADDREEATSVACEAVDDDFDACEVREVEPAELDEARVLREVKR